MIYALDVDGNQTLVSYTDFQESWLARLPDLGDHLNDRGGSPAAGAGVQLGHVRHAGQRTQSVHLAHRHGNRSRRQAGRDQGV